MADGYRDSGSEFGANFLAKHGPAPNGEIGVALTKVCQLQQVRAQ